MLLIRWHGLDETELTAFGLWVLVLPGICQPFSHREEELGLFLVVSVHHVMIIDWFNKFVSSRAILPSFTLLL